MSLKRFICALLCLGMLVVSFASCAEKPGDESNAASNTTSEGPQGLVPHLSDDKKLDGYTLTFLQVGSDEESTSLFYFEFAPDDLADEPINDSIYQRNSLIEEKYDCKIVAKRVKDYTEVQNLVRLESDATEHTFQVITGGPHRMAPLAKEGLLHEITTLEGSNLKLDGEWWDQSAIRDTSILNKLYMVTGEIALTDNEGTWGVFFNKDIIEQLSLENPYELVDKNEWTIDKMIEMGRAAKLDDGDGTMTAIGDDRWGILTQTYDGCSFMWGVGQSMVKKNNDDVPELRILDTENVTAWNKVFEVLANQDYTLMPEYTYRWDSDEYGEARKGFSEGNALFNPNPIGYVNSVQLREANIKYGILPMPKLDPSQEYYSSSCNVYSGTFIALPVNLGKVDVEKTTFILEAMAYLGDKMVTDVYYETTLKNKRFQDDDSSKILDMIFANRTFDLAAIYDWGQALYLYTNIIGSKQNTIVSTTESRISAMEADMQATIEAFEQY